MWASGTALPVSPAVRPDSSPSQEGEHDLTSRADPPPYLVTTSSNVTVRPPAESFRTRNR
jgi:hypothetical protein